MALNTFWLPNGILACTMQAGLGVGLPHHIREDKERASQILMRDTKAQADDKGLDNNKACLRYVRIVAR